MLANVRCPFLLLTNSVNPLKDRLINLRKQVARQFPDRPDLLAMIPSPEGIDPEKKLPKSLWTTDTCNQAQALEACVKGESFIVTTFIIDNNCANILMLPLKVILK